MSVAFQSIPAGTLLPERPFTHPAHTETDRLALCHLAGSLRETRDRPDAFNHAPSPVIVFYREPDQRHHRQVLVRPLALFAGGPLPIVGFFGQKQAGADRKPLDEVDGKLLSELPGCSGLIAYCTLALAGGDYGNLVVFDSPEGKERWLDSDRHEYAAQTLAPRYFASVRIYNGLLPRGLAAIDALQLNLVKYFDYSTHPTWRGLRSLHPPSQP